MTMGDREKLEHAPMSDELANGDRITHLETEAEARTDNEGKSSPPPTVVVSPDGGYGRVCVVCSTLINAHTWEAIAASNGVFLSY